MVNDLVGAVVLRERGNLDEFYFVERVEGIGASNRLQDCA